VADHQLDEISYRIKALAPDVMLDEQVRRLHAERDRLKALPAEPDRCDGNSPGTCTPTSTRRSPPPNAARG
jgi:hypothetical protein